MPKLTIKQQLIAGLTASGWTRDPQARTGKYAVFFKPGVKNRYYVGTHGALRYGRTATSARNDERTIPAIIAKG